MAGDIEHESLGSSQPISISSDMSSPLPSAAINRPRAKRPPTVTPRRFNRFFDPRSSSEHHSSSTQSSRALKELRSSAVNRRNDGRCSSDAFTAFPDTRPAKRRKGSDTSSVLRHASPLSDNRQNFNSSPPCPSSPLQRLSKEDSSPCAYVKISWEDYACEPEVERIRRSRVTYTVLPDYQTHTVDFHSRPEDAHQFTKATAPYCVAACNTNSLVAMGEEGGSIRIIESAKDISPGFSNTYLTFKPHDNAIMHMSFSSDDRWLATASGDQTCRIIDMPTQTTIHTLQGNTSTVRHVMFQPGNDNIVATCGRDGTVNLYDIRSSKQAARVQSIVGAHALDPPAIVSQNLGSAPSVTALQFLSPSHSHLFLTSSDSTARLRLWDIRGRYTVRQRPPTPITTAEPPPTHRNARHYGIVSLTSSTDFGRIYAVCKDNTVYAYSANHMILGQAPELDMTISSFKAQRGGTGLGPLYGLQHPSFRAHSFYIRAAVRKADGRHSELLALGSSEGCPVLFPTDERILQHTTKQKPVLDNRQNVTTAIPMFTSATPLIRGHTMSHTPKEVTGVVWSTEGELVSIGDDCKARCWREDADFARHLRMKVDGEAARWGCGWADVEADWDEEDG